MFSKAEKTHFINDCIDVMQPVNINNVIFGKVQDIKKCDSGEIIMLRFLSGPKCS